jgi:hypothetical protein
MDSIKFRPATLSSWLTGHHLIAALEEIMKLPIFKTLLKTLWHSFTWCGLDADRRRTRMKKKEGSLNCFWVLQKDNLYHLE